MKLKLLCGVVNMAALFSSASMTAQNYQTMPVQSGFTADVVANGVGPALSSTTSDVDGVSYAFISKDFQATSSSAVLTYGLPINGTVNSVVASTPGLVYQLADYNANNSLKLSNTNDSGTLIFTTPKAAFRLYMLATSGSGVSTVTAVVNFTDNTSQTITGITVSDWYNASGFAIQGFGRINRNTDALESGSAINPRLYQTVLNIDDANQSKPIQSITVTKTSTAQGHSNIFAFSADAYSDCAAPTLQPVGTLSSNSAAVSWTVPAGTTAASYDLYYSTTNTAPTGATAPSIPGIPSASYTLSNLQPATNYYYWVRTNCSTATGQSVWSFSGVFKTLCGDVGSLFENFDSYATGSVVPDCWARLAGTGSQTITSTTPASGTRNIYQFTGTTATPTYAILPNFSNINAGTHRLRFKARVSSGAPGSLIVGYVTSTSDAGTFVPLQTLSITNTSYTAAGAEYTVPVPNTVPAGARLAIRSANDGKSYYWDDMYWEVAAMMATSETGSAKKLTVSPNPFRNILYVSEAEKIASVTVSDMAGRVVRTMDRPSKEIELSFLNAGLYLVTFRLKDGSQYTVKAVKQ